MATSRSSFSSPFGHCRTDVSPTMGWPDDHYMMSVDVLQPDLSWPLSLHTFFVAADDSLDIARALVQAMGGRVHMVDLTPRDYCCPECSVDLPESKFGPFFAGNERIFIRRPSHPFEWYDRAGKIHRVIKVEIPSLYARYRNTLPW